MGHKTHGCATEELKKQWKSWSVRGNVTNRQRKVCDVVYAKEQRATLFKGLHPRNYRWTGGDTHRRQMYESMTWTDCWVASVCCHGDRGREGITCYLLREHTLLSPEQLQLIGRDIETFVFYIAVNNQFLLLLLCLILFFLRTHISKVYFSTLILSSDVW